MRVIYNNFMQHKYLELDLRNFMVITGENGSGKSTLFHGLKWLIDGGTNKLITYGEKQSSVELITKDFSIKREVIKDKYFIYKNDVEVSTNKDSLDKIGIDIPIEYMGQFDKLFLLSETPKNRSEILNDWFDIEKVENASNTVTKDLKELSKDLKEENEVVLDCQSRLDCLEQSYADISAIKKRYDEYRGILDRILEVKSIKDSIVDDFDKIDVEVQRDILDCILEIEKVNSNIISKIDKIEDNVNYDNLDYINDILSLRNNIIDKIDVIEQDLSDKVLSGIVEVADIKELLIDSVDKIGFKIDYGILEDIIKLKDIKDSIEEVESFDFDRVEEINGMLEGQVCPLCSGKIK